VAAIVGKVACGFVAGHGANRLAIGIGMMPRGEVGLIFASIGKSLGVISDALFSAVVLMVIVTTLATPPLLKFVLLRDRAETA
jgi:Kef-type K+ transport system membrane component KefB